jgi:hypothetical protein
MDGRVSEGALFFFLVGWAGVLVDEVVESVVLERAVRRSDVVCPLNGVR